MNEKMMEQIICRSLSLSGFYPLVSLLSHEAPLLQTLKLLFLPCVIFSNLNVCSFLMLFSLAGAPSSLSSITHSMIVNVYKGSLSKQSGVSFKQGEPHTTESHALCFHHILFSLTLQNSPWQMVWFPTGGKRGREPVTSPRSHMLSGGVHPLPWMCQPAA